MTSLKNPLDICLSRSRPRSPQVLCPAYPIIYVSCAEVWKDPAFLIDADYSSLMTPDLCLSLGRTPNERSRTVLDVELLFGWRLHAMSYLVGYMNTPLTTGSNRLISFLTSRTYPLFNNNHCPKKYLVPNFCFHYI